GRSSCARPPGRRCERFQIPPSWRCAGRVSVREWWLALNSWRSSSGIEALGVKNRSYDGSYMTSGQLRVYPSQYFRSPFTCNGKVVKLATLAINQLAVDSERWLKR